MNLSLLAYAAILAIAAALAASVVFVATPDSPARVAVSRYLGGVDQQVRALFLKTTATRIATMQLAVATVGTIAAYAIDVRGLGLVAVAAAAPRIAFAIMQARRVRVIEQQLAGWLDILSNMLRASGSLADALSGSAALIRGPLGQELDLMLKELRVGTPLPVAGRAMAARVRSLIFGGVMTLLLIGRNTGGEMPTLLQETAATLRERMRLDGVVRKQTAMGRAQILVLAMGPWGLVLMFRKVEPDFFTPLFTSGWLGQAIMTGAFVLWVVSLYMARKIMKVEV